MNFGDISVIDDDDFSAPSLKYKGRTGDGWALEGCDTTRNGWDIQPGDAFAYYTDKRSTDGFYGAGTH